MYVKSFSTKFHGNIFISLKSINLVQKKEKQGRKKINKKKSEVMTASGDFHIFDYQ